VRYRFGPDFVQALLVRDLDVGTVATLANVSSATVSAAVPGRALNVKTATRIARVVGRCPVMLNLNGGGRKREI
jgi:plasmid maintenance system antidote protein VapI